MTPKQMRRLLECITAYSKAIAHDDPLRCLTEQRLDRAAEEARIALCLEMDVDPDLVPNFSRN